jgi:ribosomal protein L7/L12
MAEKKLDKDQLLEAIQEMSVLELSELVKALEEKEQMQESRLRSKLYLTYGLQIQEPTSLESSKL